MNPIIPNTTLDSDDTDLSVMETYQRMAQAIVFMRQHYRQQPNLATIAQQVHLSEYHFQRLFTQWAGLSPKRFMQTLTIDYAKAKMAETQSLLHLTQAVGLSSPGRLHDLFVSLEAMSPGEFKAGGTGLTIDYGIHPTRFGPCLIAQTQRGLCNLHFLESTDPKEATQWLQAEWPQAQLQWNPEATQDIGDRLFSLSNTEDSPNASTGGLSSDASTQSPIPLRVKGTNFQIQVWRALLAIPTGGLTTYQGLAAAIGRPTAARAVGNAVGHNPVAYLIPCHRVIRASGELGGYRWGLERKAALLGWEASQEIGHPVEDKTYE